MAEYKPTKQEEALIDFLMSKLYIESINYDRPFRTNREDNRKFYKGDQWRRRQPPYKAKSVTNFASLIIRDEVALLTDNIPNVSIRPVDSNADIVVADILTKLVKHIFYLNNYYILQHKACKMASIEGIAYLYPYWDENANNGEGDIKIKIESADSVLRDPSGEDNYFIIEKDVTLAEIYRLFPDKADLVRAEVLKDSKLTIPTTSKRKPHLPVQSTDKSETVVYEGTQTDVIEQFQRVKLHTFWLKDDSVAYITDSENKDKIVTKKLYPYGRWIFIANGKIILDDRPCVVKHFPIVPLVLDIDPETETYGIANMDYWKQSQIDYNEMYALIKDWLRAMCYPRFKYDPRSGIDPNQIKNKWGAGIPSLDFEWVYPAPLPNDIFRFILEGKLNIEYVSGIHDVTQGRKPQGVTAAAAIHLLQEASKTMIRPKARLLEAAIKKLVELIIDYIQVGYSTKRIIRLLGIGEDETITINDVQIIDGVEEIKNNVTIGEYDVYIEPDSTLPISRIERFQTVLSLFQVGAADRYALLKESGLSDWKEINERLNRREEELKQMQMQAQQQQAQIAQQQMAQEQAQKAEQMDIKREQLDLKRQKLVLDALIAQKPEEGKET